MSDNIVFYRFICDEMRTAVVRSIKGLSLCLTLHVLSMSYIGGKNNTFYMEFKNINNPIAWITSRKYVH